MEIHFYNIQFINFSNTDHGMADSQTMGWLTVRPWDGRQSDHGMADSQTMGWQTVIPQDG